MVLMMAPGLRLRHEHFGSLAWQTNPRSIYRLSHDATAIVLLHDQPRSDEDVVDGAHALGIGEELSRALLAELPVLRVLVPTDGPAVRLARGEPRRVAARISAGTPKAEVIKPLWVHLQPFTRCNQRCIHCYCSGGPKADPFLLPIEAWQQVIATLDGYGVLDVYITGGESLLYEEFFVLAEDVLDRGMGFGVSTNATLLSDHVLNRLKDLRIASVQVSLDGGDAATHELIRGAAGSFERTLAGIDRIAAFSEAVLNTVVNRLNLHQLEQVVTVGKTTGAAGSSSSRRSRSAAPPQPSPSTTTRSCMVWCRGAHNSPPSTA